MKNLVFIISFCLYLTSCGSENNNSSNLDPACLCIPGKTVTDINSIDEMRANLIKQWSDFRLPTGQKQNTYYSGEGEIIESLNDKTCHYIYKGLTHSTEQVGTFTDEDGTEYADYSATRHFDTFSLGEETTNDVAICTTKANGIDETAVDNAYLEAIITLLLDKVLDDTNPAPLFKSFSKNSLLKKLLIDDSEDNLQFTAIEMISGHASGYKMYQLTYKVTGSNLNGNLSYRFGANVNPMAYLWGFRFKGSVEGQPVDFSEPFINSIDGVSI